MHCVLEFNLHLYSCLGGRAWDKDPTAEVASSHGRFNPTKSRVESTLKSNFHQKSSISRVPDCDFDFQSRLLIKPYLAANWED